MTLARSPLHIRNLLLVDAATCAIMGLALTLGADPLARSTAIPQALLLSAGLLLFPIAAFMLLTTTRTALWPAAVWLVVAGNGAWVAGSLWLMAGGSIAPNALGQAFIGLQALAVAGLATLEYAAFRQNAPIAAT